MRAVKTQSHLNEPRVERDSNPKLSIVPRHDPNHATRRRVGENWLLATAILGLLLFVVALSTFVFSPATSTLAGNSTESWSESNP